MIVDFTFANFRSFSDEQIFSLHVARSKTIHPSNFVAAADGKVDVLKSAAIYGANASGKSNLVRALTALQWMIVDSGDLKADEPIAAYEPFRLDEDRAFAPVQFEIEFIVPKSGRYQYRISFLQDRVLEESLYAVARQKSLLFERGVEDSWENVKFGGNYKGGVRKIPFFANNSYLSKAGNNAGSPSIIREIYRYFRWLVVLGPAQRVFAAHYLKNVHKLENVAKVLAAVDTGIDHITPEQKTYQQSTWPDDMPESVRKMIIDEQSYQFAFWHKDQRGQEVRFEEEDESAGTRRLFNLLPVVIEALRLGQVLVIDEIEDSFHPYIVNLIVRLFTDERTNMNNAQLIFTTHDTAILEPGFLRKDQVWFVDKSHGRSQIHSLDEFDSRKVKPNSPFRDWYSEGRFGGVPGIRYGQIVDIVEQIVQKDDE